MKRTVLLLAVALMGMGSMCAQEKARKEGARQRPTVEQQVNSLKQQLSLTEEQTQKVTTLYTAFEKKRQEAGETSRESLRTEREKLNKDSEALLTDEQKKTFKEMQQKRSKGQGKGNRGDGQSRTPDKAK